MLLIMLRFWTDSASLGRLARRSVAGKLARGELVALDCDLQLNRTFFLVWHPERYRRPLWQAFKVFLQEER